CVVLLGCMSVVGCHQVSHPTAAPSGPVALKTDPPSKKKDSPLVLASATVVAESTPGTAAAEDPQSARELWLGAPAAYRRHPVSKPTVAEPAPARKPFQTVVGQALLPAGQTGMSAPRGLEIASKTVGREPHAASAKPPAAPPQAPPTMSLET